MKVYIKIVFLSVLIVMACKEKKSTEESSKQLILTQTDSLDIELNAINESKILPGFSVSVFSSDKVLYQKGFGMADLEKKTDFQPSTIQIIASTTKPFVGVALMKAIEEELLDLEDNINDILPYKVVNPNFPQQKITIRMLASHTSSISGTKKSDKGYRFETPLLASKFPNAYKPLLTNYNKTDNISMSDFLEKKLNSRGEWYDEEIFTKEKPGTSYEYSNIGIALLAHIIEMKTKISFDEFTKNLIIDPLDMKSSFWELNDVPLDKHTTYYNELKNKVPNYYIITYPDGGLYSSISDMTIFLQEMMKGYDGTSKIVSKESFREMMKKQFDGEKLTEGLCWDLSFDGLIGHSGNDFGTATLMYFSPETGIGRILFTNISTETEEQEDTFYGIFNTLFKYDFEYQKASR